MSAHSAALVDQIYFGMRITVGERVLTLIKRSIRAEAVRDRDIIPQCSLQKVLKHLTLEGVGHLTESHSIQRSLFVLVLVTGYRASK